MCVGPLGGRGLDVGWSGLWGVGWPWACLRKGPHVSRGDLSFPDRGLCWNLLLLPSLGLPCGLVKGQREGGWREEGGGTIAGAETPSGGPGRKRGPSSRGPGKMFSSFASHHLGPPPACPAASCLDRPLPLERPVAEKQEEEGSRKLPAFVLGFWARSTS